MRLLLPILVLLPLGALSLSPPSSRTAPPSGAKIVRVGTTTSGEFATLGAAVAALPSDSSSQTIFIYPGTYNEQVLIQRSGPVTLLGYTSNPGSYAANQVNLVASNAASSGLSDDETGTLRIHSNNVAIYNINIKNSFGVGSQAIALSNYGDKVGCYSCGLYGYQDTLLAEQDTQVYLQSYIEGATDFIFGQTAQAYFEGNTISMKANGYVTASGRDSNNSAICAYTRYVFNRNTIQLAPNPGSTSALYLGRPWRDYARVVFLNTYVTAPLNKALWSVWSSTAAQTDHVFFADYNTTGPGIPTISRASFATKLSASQAASYTLASTIGTTSWVDKSYLF
ncbi:carbohydrate esterase family 8 protein [Heterobasidion irregulare TC 32-1]|uniref:Pectinesterase n=1 Tax=Heterobasidion irregulare (strain TC 32-1) TaxID=747525 RepID=W4KA06_HETIT|nr:carbohydrate esterase family 8 protein [Heterobasidion irregulare TC 32-1]ETW82180.1 carbohydrate esterase family 8 protein [Heterobasidion irregulare TC 32-1]